MSLCAQVNEFDQVVTTTDSIETCTGFILLDQSDFQSLSGSFLPPLAISDANLIGGAIALLFFTFWAWNKAQDLV